MPMTAKEIIDRVKDSENTQRVKDDFDRFKVYNGKLKDIIKKAISSEFARPETVFELSNRIVPLNITQKIINKLSMVYMESPMRAPLDKNPGDQELIDLYSDSLNVNMIGKQANRFFKLHKHTAWMPFLDRDGIPRLRALPSQSYTPISDDPKEPERPTAFVKHLNKEIDPANQRFSIWTDDEFLIVDGKGNVQLNDMLALNNPNGENPFGKVPFVYISENDDGNLIPISDDDLITMQVAICLLLTDLAFASKYQLWSIFVIEGADGSQKIELNPNSVINIPPGAKLTTVKPETDIDKALSLIESLISLLLTTKNLSVGDISGMVKAEGASGVAKMIDRSETTEDRKDQQAFFIDAEKRLWDLFAHNMLPWWVSTGQINRDFIGNFSDNFELSIRFMDPKPFVGDKESVEVEILKLNNNLTSMDRALKAIHNELDAEQVSELEQQINKENKERMQMMMIQEDPSDGLDDEAEPS